MRAAPKAPPAPLRWKEQLPDERRYRFLTYVFGGGVKVRGHEKHGDAVTPVRVASIRGQLRFWWRACNPSRCETVEELRQREGEIWGTTSQASKVEITVISQPPRPHEVPVYEYNAKGNLIPCQGMREIAYGAFPLQPSRDDQKKKGAQPWVLFDYGRAVFSLRFTYPDSLRDDVTAALWAWETFGGLGGRTRRGFGAVARVDGPEKLDPSRYRENPRIPGVPSLHHARFVTSRRTSNSALDAWKDGLGLLQKIRQGRGFGRNDPPGGTKKPAGRSRWPEPDQIRQLTRKSAPLHQKPMVEVQSFPRAAFGMPIVFHFNPGSKDEPGSKGDPDMKPLQLQPVDSERFASPLIIRPMGDGKDFRTAALALSSDVPDAVLVVEDTAHPVETALDEKMAKLITPLNRNGKTYTDPIALFLSELEK